MGAWSNEISGTVSGGSNIAQSTPQNTITTSITTTPDNSHNYAIHIKVVDSKNSPIKGAKVTIHSTPREAVTDENGIARFVDIEPGEHEIAISYSNYQGKQTVNLSGEAHEFQLNITVERMEASTSWASYIAIGLALLLVIFFIIRQLKKKRVV